MTMRDFETLHRVCPGDPLKEGCEPCAAAAPAGKICLTLSGYAQCINTLITQIRTDLGEPKLPHLLTDYELKAQDLPQTAQFAQQIIPQIHIVHVSLDGRRRPNRLVQARCAK